ncbi:MAG: hypothetical protein HN720_05380, partial [Nitrospinaceae bacterium]|nr:hypothetical protein [Nitrospinaceae bacterium]
MSPEKSFWLIRDFLGNVISGRQRVRRLEALVLLLLGLAFALLLAPAAVMSQPLWGYSAVVYLGAIVLILAAVASRAAWILKRPPTREKIALEIETERGDLGNNLISSLQLFPTKDLLAEDDPTSPELIDALVFETAEQVEKLDPVIFVSNAAPRRMGRLLAALGATVMFVALSWPGVYPRAGYLLANAIDLMPSRITHLHLSASVVRILPGTNVLFDVRTEGMVPGKVALEILEPADAAAGADNRHGGVVPMEELGEHQFRLKWRAGDGDVRVLARSGRFRSAPVDIKVVAPPRTESIELVSYPPEYTPFPPSRQTESADIKAYLGTSIKVRVKPDKPVKEAVIALTDGWQIPLKPGKDGYLEGAMLVGSPGSYQIKLKDFDGFENLRPPRYRIDIIPDTSPQVTIAKPGKDVDMETDDAVRLLWRAKDDLGVQGVSLEVQIGRSAPRRIRLWGEERAKKIVKGTHVIDLRAYGMRPGGMLAYRIVAEDTDTVSGPKQGASPFYRVKIRNREAVIASLDSKLNEISSNLLDLLGDYIEKEEVPEELSGGKEPGRKTAREPGKAKQGTARTIPGAKEEKSLFDKAWEIMKKVKAAKSLLRSNNPREALASMDLTTLMRRLRDVMDRHLLSRHQMRGESGSKMTKKERRAREQERLSKREEATESMERLASMGEDMLRSVRMDQVGKTADSLMQRQRDLARALEQMRKSGEASPGAKSRLEKEVSRLQKELDKLMQQLSSLARRMPGEFMNQQSMRNMPMQNMRSAFDRIRQQMRKGDFRGALDTLRRLMNQIQQLRNAMRRLQRNQMSAQRGGQPMRRRQTELGAIVKEQQAVLSGTVDVHGNVMGRMTKGWPNSLKALSRRFEKSLAEERQLAERIIELDCGPKSISK